VFVGFSRIFLLGVLIFKVLTARRLYKSFGVKWLNYTLRGITQKKAYDIQNIAKVWNREMHDQYYNSIFLYSVIHKSVKYFKNSQQIDYETDRGNSYADRERNCPSFLCIFHRCSMCPPLVIRPTSMRQPISFHTRQHITVDGHTCYYCLLAANQSNYVRELFLKKLGKFLSLSA
jgi:hypothetical protein